VTTTTDVIHTVSYHQILNQPLIREQRSESRKANLMGNFWS